MAQYVPLLIGLAGVGLVGGLVLLVRGLGDYRRALRIGSLGSAASRSVAVGESRLSGTIEAAELTLISPLQSQPCIYYRATVDAGSGRSRRRVFNEERGVGFRVRDAGGAIRVFPRGARWDVPNTWSEDSTFGDPAGLELRSGPATKASFETREQAVADLLTVHRPEWPNELGGGGGQRSYREARLAVGDAVTVIGMVLPFDQLPDPTAADEESGAAATDESVDPIVAADLAEARASNGLADSAADAWGNAAIEGFGIDRPVREPVLDPEAHRPPVATATEAQAAHQAFDIAGETLVVAASPGVPLLIAAGSPATAESRNQVQFVIGLIGGALATASAVVLALLATGTWR